MILIAHRGNLCGPNPKDENSPAYIEKAIKAGFEVEVDVWFDSINRNYFLGHDTLDYFVEESWILKYLSKIWFHCKNSDALFQFKKLHGAKFFWHENDDYTITSNGLFWVFPGQNLDQKSIWVLPELNHDTTGINLKKYNVFGVCSDYILTLNNNL